MQDETNRPEVRLNGRVAIAVAAMLCVEIAFAAPFCRWEISVLNGETRETKYYTPGEAPIDIPLEGLTGFRTCRVLPERVFDFQGSPTTRVEVLCFTNTGDVVLNQSVVSLKTGPEVTRFQLLGRPVSISLAKAEPTINSSGYREFMIYCK